jgi:hypothetical protein
MAKPPKAPRNHHYVPQLLLRRFAAPDGTLWVYDLEKSEIYPAQSKSAAFVRDLYTRMGLDGKPDHAHIENLLAERVDRPGNAAIRRLLAKEDLFTMGPPWNDFLIFVAAQLQRTPAFFDRMSQLLQPAAQESLERMAKHDHEFRRRVTQSAFARGISEQAIQQQLQRAASGGIRVTPTKDTVVSMSFALIYAIFEDLRQMTWQVATLAESDPDLILGDQPVLPVVPRGERIGLKHPAIHVKLPLSPRVAAVGNWNLQTTYAMFRAGQSDEINAETMRHAKRFLFASHRSDELLARATELHGTGPKVHIRRVKKGKGLMITHEYR